MEQPIPRSLSYDEQKAAEAAFSGRPFNPSWSQSARRIYDGILRARQATSPSSPVATETAHTFPSRTSIDVSPLAKTLGMPIPVRMTADLWNSLSTASLPHLRTQRARDLILAFLLFNCAQESPITLRFPALRWSMTSPTPTIQWLRARWESDASFGSYYLIEPIYE
jgi:hypothetical protein